MESFSTRLTVRTTVRTFIKLLEFISDTGGDPQEMAIVNEALGHLIDAWQKLDHLEVENERKRPKNGV